MIQEHETKLLLQAALEPLEPRERHLREVNRGGRGDVCLVEWPAAGAGHKAHKPYLRYVCIRGVKSGLVVLKLRLTDFDPLRRAP